MSNIIGRKQEQEELMRLYHLHQAQLVAVYGRRRVGKTFLVREVFKNRFAFYHTGLSPVELKGKSLLSAQLLAFHSSLVFYGLEATTPPSNWQEAFDRLRTLLLQKDTDERQVVFIDEMPWMDTQRAGFITAFEHFWNGWGAGQDQLLLIVCGSATSWIKDNLINSYGGLYDRVNAELQLSPFTLSETERLLTQQGVTMSRYDILQLYMTLGGIPMYISYVRPGLSLAQTIDELFFSKKAKLKMEFTRLFNSIFSSPERYKTVVTLLARHRQGCSREEISQQTGIESGKGLTTLLRTLEASDFIECYRPFGNSKRQLLYRLTDPFCLFYLEQVEGKGRSHTFWQDHENLPQLNTWRGRAFENACLVHLEGVKRALGITGVACEASGWNLRGTDEHPGMQIDLIISREDRVVNVCEMKFVNAPFSVSNDYEQTLRTRLNWISGQMGKRQNRTDDLSDHLRPQAGYPQWCLPAGRHPGRLVRMSLLLPIFIVRPPKIRSISARNDTSKHFLLTRNVFFPPHRPLLPTFAAD